ncbi:hypothetical protein N791_13880 [Lysobacter defluvii IMMIB APB-9 = DSM 18482]|uniref:Glycosyltransferase RgtA/B/C/D-like domain-containing protein n=1 Tax=Lysobacter defluvii IMMIB APB-9 = DSM 18482 TaxID=1385515 RepID=A0A0A0MB67_9GAMM|nr:hypothetical protein N791_13880 [Lysobacter defluvii IMMIB APB-9 = DSM 18482]
MAAATAWALVIRPEPFSDWLYYWRAAEGSVAYERGGVLLFVLRGLQQISLPPHLAALVINSISALAILAVAYQANGRRLGLPLLLVFAYLLAITPYHAVVQLDLSSTALLCAGIWLLAANWPPERRAWAVGLSVVLMVFAVSSRPQFFLILMVFSALLGLAAAIAHAVAPPRRLKVAAAPLVLAAGALLGFALDSALRAEAGRSEAVRTNSAVTLYAGLLSSGTTPGTCGHWSPKATHDARADADLPLLEAVPARLRQQAPEYWLQVIRCKVRTIALPDAYALYWSLGAPEGSSEPADRSVNPHLQAAIPHLYGWEGRGYRVLLLLTYFFILATAIRNGRKGRWLEAALPLLWLASFWLVHAVFEVQARYFLPLFLVLPLMAAPGMGGLSGGRAERKAGQVLPDTGERMTR